MADNTFDKGINELKDKLTEINNNESQDRIKNIDRLLKEGKLDLNGLFESELFYIHSKLHFFYHMKQPPIDKNNIIEVHSKIKLIMKNHQNYDYLDGNQPKK